jgi:phage gp29-like protein
VLWVVYAKHFVLSHYLKFAEFLGVPPLIGNAHSSDADVIDGMAQAVKNIKSASYAVLGPEDMLKVLEGKGSQADFMEFVRYVDTEIAKVINGASLGSNVAKSGSYAQSQSHEQNRDEIVKADVKFATRTANKLFAKIGKTLDLNIQIEKDVNLLQRAQTLQILNNIGYSMSNEQIAYEFDLPLPTASNTRLSLNAKSSMPLDAIDAHMDSKSFNDSLRAQEQEILETIQNLAASCESYEEVYDKLQEHYATMEFKRLDEAMFKAIAGNLIVGAVDGE